SSSRLSERVSLPAPATPEIYPLSLHDALPIYYIYVADVVAANLLAVEKRLEGAFNVGTGVGTSTRELLHLIEAAAGRKAVVEERSEEHTSELQSRENLVCRLLLEKKKTKIEIW